MTIHVSTTDDFSPRSFPNATGWHVDENGYLHVTVTSKGNCATFHPQSWRSVEREETAKAEDGK
jgi:hypothetical protein